MLLPCLGMVRIVAVVPSHIFPGSSSIISTGHFLPEQGGEDENQMHKNSTTVEVEFKAKVLCWLLCEKNSIFAGNFPFAQRRFRCIFRITYL